MVRAILDGRKTQTRRIVKGKGTWDVVTEQRGVLWPGAENDIGDWQDFECPYGEIGDRLWVREAWRVGSPYEKTRLTEFNYPKDELQDYIHYRAEDFHERELIGQYRPSIHMPRWASRINLEITGVRVERLNEISHHDAMQEGLIEWTDPPRVSTLHYGLGKADCWETTAPKAFKRLWSEINGDDSWDANPWVWVVEFKRV